MTLRSLRVRCVLCALCVEIVTGAGLVHAQTQKPPAQIQRPAAPTQKPPAPSQKPIAPPSASETDVVPIECWWKTDRSAVRVGEPFELTLTCAVVDTDAVKVVVDESSLAPSALHLVPFEIMGGNRFRDIRNSPRRFFQYRYMMRILGEDFFGKEVTLPKLELTYRLQNTLAGGGSALSGREEQYSLRPVPIRVLSIVPRDAVDIRDAPPDTFGDIDSRMFTSNMLLIAAGVALGFAGLLILVMLVRATVAKRLVAARRTSTVSTNRVLWAASRELGAVRSASQEGWSAELAGRAAAALRLAGAVALSKPIGQRRVEAGVTPGEGQIPLRRWPPGKNVMLSAAVTPAAVRNGKSDALWDGISQTLAVFTAVRYSRNGTPDGTALDTALAEAQDLVKRLRVRQLLRLGRHKAAAAEPGKQSWAR